MNWHETIEHIRTRPEYASLVEEAYLGDDVVANITRYSKSEEFSEVLKAIRKHSPNCKRILDIGSGNGISALSFALSGYEVVALEPDTSDTIGAGAIRKAIDSFGLTNASVVEDFAENHTTNSPYDLVFARQALHHANDLKRFISNCTQHLRTGGTFFTIRDHVISKQEDLQQFLDEHPLHGFYGGENAYTRDQYEGGFRSAGLHMLEILGPMSSAINYAPRTTQEVNKDIKEILKSKKMGWLSHSSLAINWLKKRLDSRNEYPGRLFSYIARKHA